MKRILAILLLVAAHSFAQTHTPNLGLSTQAHGAANWDRGLNANFNLLDDYLSGVRPLPSSFWSGASFSWNQVLGKPTVFPSDWFSINSKPSLFAPVLPTTNTPGGVFMPASCPLHSHVSGVNTANGQLQCSPDLNSQFSLLVNGVQLATGVTAINFTASSGLTITGNYNAGTGVITFTITGSTTTQAQAPTFSPLPGSYGTSQNVTLACASPSPTIYYEIGTSPPDPTHSSTVYSTPISAGANTIKAICASSGLSDSNIIAGTYSLTAPTVSLLPSSLTWGSQKVGVASNSQSATLTNTGNGTLSITSITGSGDYSQSNNCGSSVNAGSFCTINVTFTPTTTGVRTGTLTVTDSASGSPHTVSLSGTGALPTATPSPTSLAFGNQQVSTTSAARTVTVTNSSEVPLSISSVSIGGTNPGDFAQTNTCGTVSPSGSCTINVTFTPTVANARAATLSIADDAVNSPQTVSLTGSGTVPAAPVVSLSPSGITFGTQKVGTTSSTQSISVINIGNATLTISGVAVTGVNFGDFSQTNNCSSVAAGANCTITVSFTPVAIGSRAGYVSITDNASGSPHTVALSGTGAQPTATLLPVSLTFSGQSVGTTSAAQSVTLTNTSSVVLNITSIGVSGDYAQSNNCGLSLAAGTNCTISVSFSPSITGTRTGTLTVSDDSTTTPHSTSLTGTGTAPAVSLSTRSINFFTTTLNNPVVRTVTVTNSGNATLSISSIEITGPSHFTQTNDCGASLGSGLTCTITVTFTPTVVGTYSGTLSITDNAAGSPQTVSLTGEGSNL